MFGITLGNRLSPVQPFAPRSDLANGSLLAGQGVVGFALGYVLLHVELAPPVVLALGTGLAFAKAIAWVGWRREARRADDCGR